MIAQIMVSKMYNPANLCINTNQVHVQPKFRNGY
jgi:hypothetical protein